MAEVLLFHHAHGLTPGVIAFADTLRKAGHLVHTPDLYEGRTFDDLDDGVAHAQELGFAALIDRGVRAAQSLPEALVYAGFSLGVLPAQKLAQTRPGARGALLLHACIPVSEFGDAWPLGVPVQIHAMDRDPFFTDDGDQDAARALVSSSTDSSLFLYSGDRHLFMDPWLPSH
jgi:dienelactone hydrolase